METKLVRGAAVGVAVLAIGISGIRTSWWGIATETAAPDDLVTETCTLAELAVDDPSAAADGFLIDVHGPLHAVAGDLVVTDRAAAARLLEAKGRIESAIDGGATNGAELSTELAALAERLPGNTRCEDI